MSFHVFSLPPELLRTLVPRNVVNQPDPKLYVLPQSNSATNLSSRACNICLGTVFNDIEEQRLHFRSDWHRYNVKTRLKGGNAVNETEFSQLVDGLEDSISGSASEDDSDSDSDAVRTLVSRRATERSPSPNSTSKGRPRTALVWFHSPPSTQLGIYRFLFPAATPESNHLEALKDMQTPVERGRTWAMFMVAGGHFAGTVVRVSKDSEDEAETSKKKQRPKPDIEVIHHKTFHRYTTRRKQGGSQGLNDNAKGNAKSAGAMLRRYGEQALRDDIRNLIQDWAEEIEGCERIWIRASGTNRKIFMDYEGCIITKTDERLRTFPFPTRRPTQAELTRCLLELTRVKVSHLTEDDLRDQDEAYLASLPKPKPPPTVVVPLAAEKPPLPKITKGEELYREKWSRLIDMAVKGRLEPLKTFWEREAIDFGGIETRIPEWSAEKGRTLLHIATVADQEDVVKWLLMEAHADPTSEVLFRANEADTAERNTRPVAYDLTRSRGVRDVFRRCAAEHPDLWDWYGMGHVPSGLSKEMEEEREEKKKIRRKGLKDRVKEREAKEKEKEKEKELSQPSQRPVSEPSRPLDPSAPRKLGGSSGANEGLAGLTPEMRAKVERERRARAAEARMKALRQ